MKGTIMKIKTIANICVFGTIPLIQHAQIGLVEALAGITPDTPQGRCYNALTGDRCADYTTDQPLKAVLENFDPLYKTPTETLISFLNGGALEGPDRDIAEWILRDRGVSLEALKSSTTSDNPSLVDLLISLQENHPLQGDKAFEKILDLAINQEMEALCEALNDFKKPWGLEKDPVFKKVEEIMRPFSADQAEVSSSAPAPVEVPVQPTNPYLGKTPDELLALSDADPSLNNNPLFHEALNRALGGEVPQPMLSDIGSLSETFPLMSVIQRGCDFDELKSSLEVLSLDYSSQDRYSIPALNDFLRTNGLTAITTPGVGNCAFDAVLLTWFCKAGLYDPQWNTTLGAYLESQIAGFRGEIANLLAEDAEEKVPEDAKRRKGVDPLILFTRENIRTKDRYVKDNVFALIAQHLKTEIIAIAIDGTAQCCLLDTTVDCSLNPKETESLIKRHPDALIVCHNGTKHFLATRPLLPGEH